MQEEELFKLGRNLTEMESVMIQLKVHCEVALAMEKGLEKLTEEINFAKSERISDEEQVCASRNSPNFMCTEKTEIKLIGGIKAKVSTKMKT